MTETAAEGMGVLSSMVEGAQKLSILLELIERATSIAVVRDFLKSRELSHSAGSWEELRTKRILPAIDEGQLTLADLHALLRRTEGFGRQHIFLFWCAADRAAAMIAEERVRNLLLERDAVEAADDPLVIDLPAEPTFVDVRFDKMGGVKFMALKEIEKRTYRKLTSEVTDDKAMTFTKVYKVEHQRAINFARLWDNGLLEIRIASRDNATRYRDDLAHFFNRLKPIIVRNEFAEVSLMQLKKNLWAKRDELQHLVKFSTYTLQDDEGMSLRANAVLSADDLAGSERVAQSLAAFNAGAVQCSNSNIYFKIVEKGETVKEIHVLLNGEDNEFAVTAAVTEEEYEYVLHQVLKHN
ncbi:hypothetical protein [Ottowia caeni]|uniref:hypothetical protein n=1 Tax=Ottowia caeni TaxID=2870339 RepID=UPI001E4E641B|nr:hypothetical protein [Ottowia caeni]